MNFSNRMRTAKSPAAATFEVPKLSRSTLNEEVYEKLKEALISGKIAPGSVMTIRSLAQSFGISVMPVREALRRLVAEHVLYLLPNRSVALPVITQERFREITRIRTALEGLAAEEGARRISADKIEYMARMNDLMEKKPDQGTAMTLEWNREFHFTLYRASAMPTLVKMIESLWLQVGPLLNLQQQAFKAEKITVYVHHHRVLRALKNKTPADAGAAIVSDIEDAAQIITDRL
jgi:DNA-binding GntR family transcriptional regulator